MSLTNYTINLNAQLAASAGSISAGQVLCINSTGTAFVKATAANLAAVNNMVSGISLTDSNDGSVVQIQTDGMVTADITGLGAGSPSRVRVSSTGNLERVSSPSADDVLVGLVDAFGNLRLTIGTVASASAIFINVRDYGAVGDGSTDDTAAIQAALDTVSGASNLGSGTIYFPMGIYCHTGLLLIGTAGNGFVLRGASVGRLPYGSSLKYTGASAGTGFEMRGVNKTRIEHLGFDGNAIANPNMWVRSNQAYGGVGSSGVTFDNCVFTGAKNVAGRQEVALGEVTVGDTYQVSEVLFNNCVFQGVVAAAGSGLVARQGGNTKNFWCVTTSFNLYSIGIDFQEGSGVFGMFGGGFGNIASACAKIGNMQCVLDAAGVENVGTGFQAAKYIDSGGTGGGGSAACSVRNTYIIMDTTVSSDAVMFNFPGHFLVENCSIDGYQLCKIKTGDCVVGTSVGSTASVVSRNNKWRYGTGRIAVIDGSANDLTGEASTYAPTKKLAIDSSGDSGGDLSGAAWAPYRGSPTPLSFLEMFHNVTSSGITRNYVGETRHATHCYTIPYTALQAAAVGKVVIVSLLNSKTKVCGMICDVTQAFAGLAGTIRIRVGNVSEGDEYIAEFDAKTAAVTRGIADAHLGTALVRSAAVQGGEYSSWTSGQQIFFTIYSGTGNLSGLNAGSVKLYVTTESFGAGS